jgi:cyclopropane fatty-acyl-phospholipid synthase-like methyltransferase
VKETATQQSTYALGHSEQELERLSRQAQAFEPFTRQLLQQAGINTGMRVLDVGCGSGDVAFLAADLVGPTGRLLVPTALLQPRSGQRHAHRPETFGM